MLLWGLSASFLIWWALGQLGGPGRKRVAVRARRGWERWVSEPRSAVLFVLFSVLVFGGGRKLFKAWRARAAVARLGEPDVSPGEIADTARHGRAGLMDLFRILGSSPVEAQRDAAGQALSVLWSRDELIAEEEKAFVRRGFQVRWKARKRYPRGLRAPIPVAVDYGVPFLRDGGPGVGPENLEWSHRVTGAGRASLEVFGPWVAGDGRAEFELIPSDFETDGPHRLVLQARVRTVGLTAAWEMELPHFPFAFEFDPKLAVDALFSLPDETRAAAFSRAVRLASPPHESKETGREPLVSRPMSDSLLDLEIDNLRPGGAAPDPKKDGNGPANFLRLNFGLAIRNVPEIEVTAPLPCDLAHAIEVEFEGVPGWFAAGELLLSGQNGEGSSAEPLRFPIGPIGEVPADAIERPGIRPMRARLVPDPNRGWADPEVRSIWPEAIVTEWMEVVIVRE